VNARSHEHHQFSRYQAIAEQTEYLVDRIMIDDNVETMSDDDNDFEASDAFHDAFLPDTDASDTDLVEETESLPAQKNINFNHLIAYSINADMSRVEPADQDHTCTAWILFVSRFLFTLILHDVSVSWIWTIWATSLTAVSLTAVILHFTDVMATTIIAPGLVTMFESLHPRH
jgi:hypothetical protein